MNGWVKVTIGEQRRAHEGKMSTLCYAENIFPARLFIGCFGQSLAKLLSDFTEISEIHLVGGFRFGGKENLYFGQNAIDIANLGTNPNLSSLLIQTNIRCWAEPNEKN